MLVKQGFLLVPLIIGVVFAESTAIAEAPTARECIAANEAAQDLRRAGKLHDARIQLAFCVAASCPAPLREDCSQRLAEIEAAMPTLVLEAKDAQGNDISPIRITMDHNLLADALDGAAIAVDPGEHRFVVEAEGFSTQETTIVVREGDKRRHVPVVLGSVRTQLPKSVLPGPTTEVVASGGAAGFPPAAYVAFGAAGSGVILGTVFTVLAIQAKSEANAACPNGENRCPAGVDTSQLNDRITVRMLEAEIGFAAAAAGGAVGTFVLLTSNGTRSQAVSQARVEPRIGIGWAGVRAIF